jgi:hypothetical protein
VAPSSRIGVAVNENTPRNRFLAMGHSLSNVLPPALAAVSACVQALHWRKRALPRFRIAFKRAGR